MYRKLLKLTILSVIVSLGCIITSCKTNSAALSSSNSVSLKDAVKYNGDYLAEDPLTDSTFAYKYTLVFLSDDFLILKKETYDKTNVEYNEKNYDINTTIFYISDLKNLPEGGPIYYMTLTASSETVSMIIDNKELTKNVEVDKSLTIELTTSLDKNTLLIRTSPSSPESNPLTFTYSDKSENKK